MLQNFVKLTLRNHLVLVPSFDKTLLVLVLKPCDKLIKCKDIFYNMATLMESYEQQYSSLTAEIVAKTGRIPNLSGGTYVKEMYLTT